MKKCLLIFLRKVLYNIRVFHEIALSAFILKVMFCDHQEKKRRSQNCPIALTSHLCFVVGYTPCLADNENIPGRLPENSRR